MRDKISIIGAGFVGATAAFVLAVVVAIGVWAARRTRTTEDFFIAGRALGLIVLDAQPARLRGQAVVVDTARHATAAVVRAVPPHRVRGGGQLGVHQLAHQAALHVVDAQRGALGDGQAEVHGGLRVEGVGHGAGQFRPA